MTTKQFFLSFSCALLTLSALSAINFDNFEAMLGAEQGDMFGDMPDFGAGDFGDLGGFDFEQLMAMDEAGGGLFGNPFPENFSDINGPEQEKKNEQKPEETLDQKDLFLQAKDEKKKRLSSRKKKAFEFYVGTAIETLKKLSTRIESFSFGIVGLETLKEKAKKSDGKLVMPITLEEKLEEIRSNSVHWNPFFLKEFDDLRSKVYSLNSDIDLVINALDKNEAFNDSLEKNNAKQNEQAELNLQFVTELVEQTFPPINTALDKVIGHAQSKQNIDIKIKKREQETKEAESRAQSYRNGGGGYGGGGGSYGGDYFSDGWGGGGYGGGADAFAGGWSGGDYWGGGGSGGYGDYSSYGSGGSSYNDVWGSSSSRSSGSSSSSGGSRSVSWGRAGTSKTALTPSADSSSDRSHTIPGFLKPKEANPISEDQALKDQSKKRLMTWEKEFNNTSGTKREEWLYKLLTSEKWSITLEGIIHTTLNGANDTLLKKMRKNKSWVTSNTRWRGTLLTSIPLLVAAVKFCVQPLNRLEKIRAAEEAEKRTKTKRPAGVASAASEIAQELSDQYEAIDQAQEQLRILLSAFRDHDRGIAQKITEKLKEEEAIYMDQIEPLLTKYTSTDFSRDALKEVTHYSQLLLKQPVAYSYGYNKDRMAKKALDAFSKTYTDHLKRKRAINSQINRILEDKLDVKLDIVKVMNAANKAEKDPVKMRVKMLEMIQADPDYKTSSVAQQAYREIENLQGADFKRWRDEIRLVKKLHDYWQAETEAEGDNLSDDSTDAEKNPGTKKPARKGSLSSQVKQLHGEREVGKRSYTPLAKDLVPGRNGVATEEIKPISREVKDDLEKKLKRTHKSEIHFRSEEKARKAGMLK